VTLGLSALGVTALALLPPDRPGTTKYYAWAIFAFLGVPMCATYQVRV
jgi:hypothetical protein